MINNIKHIFKIILSRLAKFLLLLTGWNFITEKKTEYKKLTYKKNYLFIFPHTTYWDGVIFLLYRTAYPEIFANSRLYLTPQIYDNLPYAATLFLNHIGFLRAKSINESKKENTIEKTISQLKQEKSNFLLWISPKGSIMNRPWKSGYYYLAKELNVPIAVLGLDFEKKEAVLADVYDFNYETDTIDIIEEKIRHSLGKITPLNPENSEIQINTNYDKNNLSAVNWKNLFFFLFLLLVVICLFWYFSSIFTFLKLLSTFIGFI